MSADGLDISGSRRVDLAEGIWALLPSTLHEADHEGYQVDVTIDSVEEGIGVTELVIKRLPEGRPVDPGGLRTVRLGELSERAVWTAVQMPDEDSPEALNPASLLINSLRPWIQPGTNGRYSLPSDEVLKAIALLHNAATLVGANAQRFLMEQFDLPRATVNYWVIQARKRGYLIERSGDRA